MPKNILYDKMIERYENLEDFMRRSGIKENLARETCRRAIYDNQPINTPSLIMLTKHLGFTSKEIARIIKDAGDTEFYELFDSSQSKGRSYSASEEAIIDIVRAVEKKDPQLLSHFANMLELLASGAGVDVADQLSKIKVKPPRGARKHGRV